jgi:hypothetical protein
MTRRCLFGVLAAVLFLTGGCVQTAMLPAQQIEAGETVATVSLDEPGFLYIPRANVQFTAGLGGGDVSANVSGPLLGAGMTGRYYLSGRLNAEMQGQVTGLSGGLGEPQGLLLLGVKENPTGGDTVYLGARAGAIHGPPFLDFGGSPGDPPQTHPVVGATVGMGPFEVGSSWQVQVELEGNAPIAPGSDDPPLPATRISVGLFYLGD